MITQARLFPARDIPPELPFADYERPQTSWNHLIIVGEAPGAEEIKLGRPFVGRSGKLLDQALAQAGIDRPACFIANVFQRQPPGNKVDHFFASRRAAQQAGEALREDWGALSGKYCRAMFTDGPEQLHAVILAERPRALLALGRTPLWALTGQNGIAALAGGQFPCRFAPDIPVIATWHPSFILRGNWRLQPDWIDHIRLAGLAASAPVRAAADAA